VKVFVELAHRDDVAFDHAAMLSGLDHEVHFAEEPLDRVALRQSISNFVPDMAVIIGWRSPMCRFAAEDPGFAAIPKIFAFDMPFAWTLRKLVAPVVLRRYLRRFAAAFVPGRNSARYARHLGFPLNRIEMGLISVDTAVFAEADRRRRSLAMYPRRFLYVGRYAPEKRIDLLVEAYRRYRMRVSDPWTLTCCGMGPERKRLVGEHGLSDQGFVQPKDLPEVYAHHGAFVIASDYEPWGMVIAEAAAAGLPVVCTDACGAHHEIVRSGINGVVCASRNAARLTDALVRIHEQEHSLPEMGRMSREFAAPFSNSLWVQRLLTLAERFVERPGQGS
jgi:glycosyltransferase involved in cell wall biosynthesis